MAHVKANGTVHWKQMSGLKATCAPTGLEPIPFYLKLSLMNTHSKEEGREVEAKQLGEEEERNKNTEEKREMKTRFDIENDATAKNIEISIHDQNYSVYNDKSNIAKYNNGKIDTLSDFPMK
eukprot:9080225-Ditylum_brightwellii.AAC.1